MTELELKRRALVSHSEANDYRHMGFKMRAYSWRYDGPTPSIARQVARTIELVDKNGTGDYGWLVY